MAFSKTKDFSDTGERVEVCHSMLYSLESSYTSICPFLVFNVNISCSQYLGIIFLKFIFLISFAASFLLPSGINVYLKRWCAL